MNKRWEGQTRVRAETFKDKSIERSQMSRLRAVHLGNTKSKSKEFLLAAG